MNIDGCFNDADGITGNLPHPREGAVLESLRADLDAIPDGDEWEPPRPATYPTGLGTADPREGSPEDRRPQRHYIGNELVNRPVED